MQTNYELIRIPGPVLCERLQSLPARSADARRSTSQDLARACQRVGEAQAIETVAWFAVAISSLAALLITLWIP